MDTKVPDKKKKHRLAIRHWPPSRLDRFPPKQQKKKIFIPRRESRNLWAVCPPTWSILFDDEKNFVVFFFLPPLPTEEEAARLYKQRGDLLNKCIAADNRSTWLDTGGRKEEKKSPNKGQLEVCAHLPPCKKVQLDLMRWNDSNELFWGAWRKKKKKETDIKNKTRARTCTAGHLFWCCPWVWWRGRPSCDRVSSPWQRTFNDTICGSQFPEGKSRVEKDQIEYILFFSFFCLRKRLNKWRARPSRRRFFVVRQHSGPRQHARRC